VRPGLFLGRLQATPALTGNRKVSFCIGPPFEEISPEYQLVHPGSDIIFPVIGDHPGNHMADFTSWYI